MSDGRTTEKLLESSFDRRTIPFFLKPWAEDERPTAACLGVAVREEDCARYFEGSPLCRFMNSLAKVRPEANFLPAGLQLPGGFVRLHIVEKETNRMLWELLDVLARTEAHELEYRFPPKCGFRCLRVELREKPSNPRMWLCLRKRMARTGRAGTVKETS
jgi:hypothetical protein